MKKRNDALIACKAFLDSSPSDVQEKLIHLLSPSEQQGLHALHVSHPLTKEAFTYHRIEHIHPSWLAPYLRTLSEGDIGHFLGALTSAQSKGLQKELGYSGEIPKHTRPVKEALQRLLEKQVIFEKDVLPPALLPDAPLNTLLTLTPAMLTKVIHYLGLHDLSFEMRQIIATATLKKIFASLPAKEGEYLKTLLLHREPLVFKRLFLEKWDGERESLRKLVEERGLHRLAHALYNADPSLKWHITRLVDIHLGTTLLKYSDKPTHARSDEILLAQITKILETLQAKGQ